MHVTHSQIHLKCTYLIISILSWEPLIRAHSLPKVMSSLLAVSSPVDRLSWDGLIHASSSSEFTKRNYHKWINAIIKKNCISWSIFYLENSLKRNCNFLVNKFYSLFLLLINSSLNSHTINFLFYLYKNLYFH